MRTHLFASPPVVTAPAASRIFVRDTVIAAAYLVLFVILDYITLSFKESPEVVTWYPPAGLGFALLLVFGLRFVPVVAIASIISSIFIYRFHDPVELLLFWGVILSSVYGAAAVFLRHRIRFDWRMRTLRDVTMLVFTTFVVSLILSVLAISGSVATSQAPQGDILRAMFHWWIGETVGVLTVTPFLLIYVMPAVKLFAEGHPVTLPTRQSFPRPSLTFIGQAASLVFMLYWVFGVKVMDEFHPLYLIILPLIWIALHRGLRGLTAGVVALNFGVMLLVWYFRFDLARLGELQLLMIVNCIVCLLLGAVATERHQAEESLASERNLLSTLINTIPDRVYVKDSGSHFILNNLAHIHALGASSQDDVAGKTDHDFRQQDLADAYRADDLRVMQSGEALYNREETTILPNGQPGTLLSSKVPFRNSNGEVTGLVGVSRDITDRKQSEQLLMDMQRRESIGILAGGIAHDFNNLLGSMMGNISLAQSRLPAHHPAAHNIDKALLAMERAANLTKQMLAYSGKGKFQNRTIDIVAMVNEHVSLFTVSLPKNVRLVTHLPSAPVYMNGDPGQIEQVIMNLIINGGEAIGDKNGAVTITVDEAAMEQAELAQYTRITNSSLTGGRFVRLELSDNGIGMSEETQARIFDPFFTTKFTGRGLGLSAVLGIIRGHGGGVTIESATGKGTTFRIVLPAVNVQTSPDIGVKS